MDWPDNWDRVEEEYNKNYDPYSEDEIEEEEDDRSKNDGRCQE